MITWLLFILLAWLALGLAVAVILGAFTYPKREGE